MHTTLAEDLGLFPAPTWKLAAAAVSGDDASGLRGHLPVGAHTHAFTLAHNGRLKLTSLVVLAAFQVSCKWLAALK